MAFTSLRNSDQLKLQRLKPVRSRPITTGLKPGSPKKRHFPRHTERLFQRFALFTFLLLVLSTSLRAAPRQLQIEKFSSEIIVEPDSSLNVTETIQVNFIGAWHGLYRTIPVEYVTPEGFNYSLFVKLESATDAAGQSLKVVSSRQGHDLKWQIFVDDATDTERTIQLHYQVRSGMKFFEGHDELYWNVTGDQWDVPIEDASAQILLPPGVTGVQTNVYTGSYRSRGDDATVKAIGSTVAVSMRRPLSFHEGLTVSIGMDKGSVKEPGAGDLIDQFLASNWPIFLPIGVLLFMFWLWFTRGRDPRVGPVSVQYAPPEGMSPAEAGTLVDEKAAMRDITATIVDLAVRGYMVIEEKETSGMMGLVHNKEYVFHLKKSPAEWSGLKAHELALLAGIFSSGTESDVELSALQNQFYKNIPAIRNSIFDALMEHGYFQHRPDYVRNGYLAGGFIVGVTLFLTGNWLSQRTGVALLPFFIAGIASGGIIAGFGWFMPARTSNGTKALAGVLGFEDFLTHVESDHMNRISQTPETFEKFLPYAMALGVEKKWVGSFQNIYSQPPSWYQGGYYNGGFYPIVFINSLDNMTMRASSVMASAPRSSGGSGFGGGGFAGGGFGGGGGGGF